MLRYFFILLLPLSSSAAETTPPVISAGSYLQTGLSLALIIILLIGGAWLAKKLSGDKGFGQSGLKIIGGVALGPRERIVLIEVGEQWLVVGIVPGQIRTLHRLTKDSTISNAHPQTKAEQPFSQWLQNVVERRKHD